MSINPKIIHGMDESFQDILNYTIPVLASFYAKCTKEGFKNEEAFELTKMFFQFLLSTVSE